MANPLLTDEKLRELSARGNWAPPDPGTRVGAPTDTVSPWERAGAVMTTRGVASATGVLMVLLLAAGVVGWNMVEADPLSGVKFPAWMPLLVIGGFVCALVASFKPRLAKVLAPIYAIVEGLFVGAISHLYDFRYNGIVVQAAGATVAVFAVMYLLHVTRIVKVTDRMRRVVMGATLGLMLFYAVSFLINLFTDNGVTFLNSASPLGIGFSVLVVALAAFNLSLDFDTIERGVAARLPKQMEWVCALGLVVTIVWLYLEILRLLSKLQSRD